jgi:acetaldehyde dehydrogenase (acetylating)
MAHTDILLPWSLLADRTGRVTSYLLGMPKEPPLMTRDTRYCLVAVVAAPADRMRCHVKVAHLARAGLSHESTQS